MSMKKKNDRENQLINMVLTAVLCALVTVMTFIPALGYIPLGFVEATTLHVVTILAGVLLGFKAGIIVGSTWGITCIIYAFMRGLPQLLIFKNPLVSVLPRIIVGILVPLYFMMFSNFFKRVIKNKSVSRNVSIVVTSIFGTITNTFLVLLAMLIFSNDMGEMILMIFSVNMLINVVVESIIAAILVPILCAPLGKMVERNTITSKTDANSHVST